MQVMGVWCTWCSDCFTNCCGDKNTESDHLFHTSIIQQPIKTVRRISSVGQTLTNEDGEEIEMPRHSSILQSYNGVPIPWSSSPVSVQPGVSKLDFENRLKTLPTISEIPNLVAKPKRQSSWKFPIPNLGKKEYSPSKFIDKSNTGDIQLKRYTRKVNKYGEEECSAQEEFLKFYQQNVKEKQPRLHKGSCSSSPNLVCLEQAAEKYSASNYTVGSLTNVSIRSNLAKSMTWLHSQSLEDVNDKQLEAERLARQYGLDLSLYKNVDLIDSPDKTTTDLDNRSDLLTEESAGFVEFSIYVNTSQNLLSIFVSKVGGLSGTGMNKLPYSVLLKVGPLSNKNVKTSKKTAPNLNPIINQSFTFFIKNKNNMILRVSAYNSDFLGRFDAIGHILISLQEVECNKNYRMKLYKQTLVGACSGMMQLSCHNVGDRFHINIIRVYNLLPKFRNHKVYMKISYYSLSRKSKEKISPLINNTGGKDLLEFNYQANFRIDLTGRKHNYVVISFKSRGSHTVFKNDESIGRLIIGPCFYSEDGNLTPWGRVILNKEHLCNTFKLYL